MITLVLGGARSGKSAVAERIVLGLPQPVTYLATARIDPSDADHVSRIDRHRSRRPPSWSTVEVDAALPAALRGAEGTALVDSLGTWVAGAPQMTPDAESLVAALLHRSGDTVLVSEEVGLGVHPSSQAGNLFRDALGQLNLAVAAVADDVLLVVAGRVLPLARP